MTDFAAVKIEMNHRKRALLLVIIPALILIVAGFFIYKSQSLSEAQLLLDEAIVLLEKEDAQSAAAALPLLNRATAMAPNLGDAYVARSYAYFLLKQPEKAAANGLKAISLNPDDAWAHINYGVALLDMKQAKSALHEFERAVALEPENANAYYNLAIAHVRLGREPQAVQAYDKAIQFNPQWALAHLSKGETLYRQGKYALAFRSFSAAIRFGSGDTVTEAYIRRGRSSAGNGKYQKAIADYDTAILIAPKNSRIFYNRGVAYQRLKNFPVALNNFNQAIALNPNYKSAYKYRAQIYSLRKEWKKALGDFNKALALDSNDGSARRGRIWVNYQLGKAKEVERDCNYLIAHNQLRSEAYSYRGLAHILQFRDAAANKDFATARELAKTDKIKTSPAAWKALEKIAAEANCAHNSSAREIRFVFQFCFDFGTLLAPCLDRRSLLCPTIPNKKTIRYPKLKKTPQRKPHWSR